MNTGRPFASWSQPSLEQAWRHTTAWIAEMLVDFGRRWPEDAARGGLAAYCQALDQCTARLQREQKRVDALAAELELREHWVEHGHTRVLAGETWTLVRTGDAVHYVRESAGRARDEKSVRRDS